MDEVIEQGRLHFRVEWSVEDAVLLGVCVPAVASILQLAAVVDSDAFEILDNLKGETHGVVLLLLAIAS